MAGRDSGGQREGVTYGSLFANQNNPIELDCVCWRERWYRRSRVSGKVLWEEVSVIRIPCVTDDGERAKEEMIMLEQRRLSAQGER